MPKAKKVTKKPYLTSKQLGIKPLTRKYLVYAAKTLPKLTTPQKLNGGTFGFYMPDVLKETSKVDGRIYHPLDFQGHECGTAGCILGLMQYKAKLDQVPSQKREEFFDEEVLEQLFYPDGCWLPAITNKHAAVAVDHFLRTGKIKFPTSTKE